MVLYCVSCRVFWVAAWISARPTTTTTFDSTYSRSRRRPRAPAAPSVKLFVVFSLWKHDLLPHMLASLRLRSLGVLQRMATLRPQLIRVLHLSGHSAIDEEALKRFDAYVNDREGSPLPADLRCDNRQCSTVQWDGSDTRQDKRIDFVNSLQTLQVHLFCYKMRPQF